MDLKIAHLYGDIMNIYGDWGNISTLLYRCRLRGIEATVTPISIGSGLSAGDFDCFFFGGGQDGGQELVAADLPRIVETLKAEVEAGVGLLSVCGGYQLLGHQYHTSDGQTLAGAGILPVTTGAGDKRMMNNLVVAVNPTLDLDRSQAATLVGFENHSGRTTLNEGAQALGRVVKGNGNNGVDGSEGVVYQHAIGTYLHGSCLPKNPHLADWLIQKSLVRRFGNVDLAPLNDDVEWQAHRIAVGLKA